MEIKFTKDITKIGTSKGITIPNYFTKQIKLEVGEVVEVIIRKVVKQMENKIKELEKEYLSLNCVM